MNSESVVITTVWELKKYTLLCSKNCQMIYLFLKT